MKQAVLFLLCLGVLVVGNHPLQGGDAVSNEGGAMSEELARPVEWLGHASFRIRGSKIVYIDPWKVQRASHDGDIVLVTHSHYDHLANEDIALVCKAGTTIIAPHSIAEKLKRPDAHLLHPGESVELDGVKIETVRAYNTNKDFHPRSQEWVGYIVELDGVRFYHAGDTDLIEEMEQVKCDVALLPVGGTYTMDAEEAVEALSKIAPRVAIPMHWGDIVGDRANAEYVRDHATCEVVIKEPVK